MEKAIDKGIEIDSNYGLMQVYNYINQDKSSLGKQFEFLFQTTNGSVLLMENEWVRIDFTHVDSFAKSLLSCQVKAQIGLLFNNTRR